MNLTHPFKISSRLLPAVQVTDGWISLERDGTTGDNRDRFRWYIDIPAGEFTGNDLKSGCGGSSEQEAFCSLLSFLTACAESWRHAGTEGENSDLFPQAVAEWAAQNSDELSMLQCEIEETKDLITD